MSERANSAGKATRRELLCLALILVALLVALAWEARVCGVTVDEPSHLVSAYLYWRGADRLEPHDMPPLIKLVGGWVPRLLVAPVPWGQPGWDQKHEWFVALEMMERLKRPQIGRLFFYLRLPMLIFPVLTAWLLWHWGRQMFGPWVAVVLALLYALEPTAMAHGALFKNDIAATFGYFLFWYRAWRFWRDPRLRQALWLGLALLLAILAKMSLLILAPLAPFIVLLRFATLRAKRLRLAACAVAILLVVPYLGALAAYQFQAQRLQPRELAAVAANLSLPQVLLAPARLFSLLPVPENMWKGLVHLIESHKAGNRIYLLGGIHPNGHPLYFLVCLAVKVPVPLQLLGVCGVVMLAVRFKRGQLEAADAFWLLPGPLYLGLASLSSLQLGARLVLPALPFGLMLCGLPAARWFSDRRIAVLAGLLAWLAVSSLQVFPRGISYFNVWAGGPEHGLQYLADSNIDWGQDLPALAELVSTRGIPKIRLSYFGTDNPWAYFSEQQLELVAPPWNEQLAQGAIYQPKPGFYAISANLIPGHMFEPRWQDYYRAFRRLEPIAKAGYSIYLYYIP